MQTNEPRKRVNWIFVIILIIVIPLIVLSLFLLNTAPSEINQQKIQADSLNNTPDTLNIDSTQNMQPQ